MSSVTQWFCIDECGHPVRRGWYDIKYNEDEVGHPPRMYWDGTKWLLGEDMSPSLFGNDPEDLHEEYWRGLTEKGGA